MPTTPDTKRFLVMAVGGVLLLSLAWIWIGPAYNYLLVAMVSPFLPDIVTLGHEGHTIDLSAQLSPQETNPQVWHMSSMMMHYGLIVALALLLAVPRVGWRGRLLLFATVVTISLASHFGSLLVLVDKVESIIWNQEPAEGIFSLGRTLHYGWLGAPSLVWLPALLWSWQQAQQGGPRPTRSTAQVATGRHRR